MEVDLTYGEVAYNAYCAKTNFKSLISGAQLPPWGSLQDKIRDAWQEAGKAAVMFHEQKLILKNQNYAH